MSILRTIVMLAILIKCVTASTDDRSQFREAVDDGDMAKAVQLRGSTLGNLHERLNYVVDNKDSDFIFDFARQTGVEWSVLLVALHRRKSPEMIEEAFEVFKFSQGDLKEAVSKLELMCSPNDFFNLLGKIEKQEDQEKAIDDSVENLFYNKRTECLDPLLDALEGNESCRHLKDAAIRKAFKEGSLRKNKSIVERFYDHSAVYADRLISSGKRSTQDPIFIFLLGEADQGDLNAVKRHWHETIPNEFKKAINKAFLTAKPSGDRLIRHNIERAKLMMETLESDSSRRVPTVISQIIASYFIDESTPEPRIRVFKLVMNALGKDPSRRVPTEISELISSYLSDGSILKSITTSFKQTISIKGTEAGGSDSESE